jgi:hypothetical protein
MAKKTKGEQGELVGFLGIGLDNQDGQQRVTRNEHFLLVGGSAEAHARMQDASIYFNEQLQQRGKRLQDTEPQEAVDLLREALDQQG